MDSRVERRGIRTAFLVASSPSCFLSPSMDLETFRGGVRRENYYTCINIYNNIVCVYLNAFEEGIVEGDSSSSLPHLFRSTFRDSRVPWHRFRERGRRRDGCSTCWTDRWLEEREESIRVDPGIHGSDSSQGTEEGRKDRAGEKRKST